MCWLTLARSRAKQVKFLSLCRFNSPRIAASSGLESNTTAAGSGAFRGLRPGSPIAVFTSTGAIYYETTRGVGVLAMLPFVSAMCMSNWML